MDTKTLIGKPFFAVIDEICRGVTDADRWAAFEGFIELSEGKVVKIGGDFISSGIRIIGGPEPQKTKSEIDAEAYAAALRPLFEKLVSCALVARCRPIAPASGGQEFDFPGDGWEDPWKLIIEAKRATLVDEAGNKHKVLSLRLGSEAHPAMQATAAKPALQTEHTEVPKKKNAPGGKKQHPEDHGHVEMMWSLLQGGIAATRNAAMSHMIRVLKIEWKANSEKAWRQRINEEFNQTFEEVKQGKTVSYVRRHPEDTRTG